MVWQNLIESSGQKCVYSGLDGVTLKLESHLQVWVALASKLTKRGKTKLTAIENTEDVQWRVRGKSHPAVSLWEESGKS